MRRGGINSFHQAVLDNGDAAVLVLDPDDLSVRWASPAARRLFGEGSGPFPDLVSAQDAAAVGTFLHGATTSVAVGAVEVDPAATITDAVDEASVAVLRAKDAGRNTVVSRRAAPDR